MNRQRNIELLIGLMFFVLLVLVVLIVLNFNVQKKAPVTFTTTSWPENYENYEPSNSYTYTTQNTPKNNENYNNLHENSLTGNVVYKYPDYNYVVYKRNCDEYYGWDKNFDCDHYNWAYWDEEETWNRKDRNNHHHYWYKENDWNDKFSSYGRHIRKNQGRMYVDEYYVYIRNEDKYGKYFEVVFYFEDEEGIEDSQSVLRYVDARESEKVVYKDMHFEKHNYENWDYEIFSQDNGFERCF